MNARTVVVWTALVIAGSLVNGVMAQDKEKQPPSVAFTFGDIKYFDRWSKGDQHEYTPEGQEDLERWMDMVTINYYRRATNGDALAGLANAILAKYKANKALVIRTASVPKTKDAEAEHLIVVVFGRPDFVEAAFARLKLHNEMGAAVIYSHRLYGEHAPDKMSEWLKANGPTVEKNLMKWDAIPKAPPVPATQP